MISVGQIGLRNECGCFDSRSRWIVLDWKENGYHFFVITSKLYASIFVPRYPQVNSIRFNRDFALRTTVCATNDKRSPFCSDQINWWKISVTCCAKTRALLKGFECQVKNGNRAPVVKGTRSRRTPKESVSAPFKLHSDFRRQEFGSH